MVRGNWQHRVEKADARKESAKQRKHRTEERRQTKQWFQELLQQLDRNDEAVRSQPELHLWTDVAPSSSEQLFEVIGDEDGRNGKRRDKGRPRSDSNADKGKKKAHPRSKASLADAEEKEAAPLLLCRNSFLRMGKKSSSQYLQYSSCFDTLGSVLGESSVEIPLIEKALIDATAPELLTKYPGAMTYLYHMRVSLSTNEKAVSTTVTAKLTETETPASSVYYAAFSNGVLLFDRYRGGVKLDEKEFYTAAANKPLNRRSSSVCSDRSEDEEGESFKELPSTVLEHILLFLPDTSIGASALVCKAWFEEIGQHSPNLWISLLKRRNWPVPDILDEDSPNKHTIFRYCFQDHYTVLRDVKALSTAAAAIASRQTAEELEMCYQDFTKRKDAPNQFDVCVAVHAWSKKLVLAGYTEECSLRLFEATEMRCRELICVNVSPYKNTKKRNCRLQANALDEDAIGCLCSVSSTLVEAEGKIADILLLLRREDFLLGELGSMKVIDIGETFLNFLFSADVVDHRMLPLFDYLNDGGEIGGIEVKTSTNSLCACGFGRFLLELSVSIPDLLSDDEQMILLDRKLVIFSSNFDAIIWCGESYPSRLVPYPPQEQVKVALCRARGGCSIASKSCRRPEIIVTEIDDHGSVTPPRFIEISSRVRTEVAKENYSFVDNDCLFVTSTEVISVDILVNRDDDNEIKDAQSVLAFFPLYPVDGEAEYNLLRLPPGYMIRRLDSHAKHLIVVCTVIQSSSDRDEETDDLDGQWFSSPRRNNPVTVAVVVSMEARCIVGQVDYHTDEELMFSSFGEGGTIGMSTGARGIAVTGTGVRTKPLPRFDSSVTSPPFSKKKKKAPKRSGKKDGFARGMSLRG